MKWIDFILEKMFNIKHEDPIVDFFGGQQDLMKESDYLKEQRKSLVLKDSSNNEKMLLTNNPNRNVSLRKSTVLKRGVY